MKDIFKKWFMSINSSIIRLSRGRIGSKPGTKTILILHTAGRAAWHEVKVIPASQAGSRI